MRLKIRISIALLCCWGAFLSSAARTGDVFDSQSILQSGLASLIKSCSKNSKNILLGSQEKLAYVSCYDLDLAGPLWTAHILFSDREKNAEREDMSKWTVPDSIKKPPVDSMNIPNGYHLESALRKNWDRGHLVPNNDMPTEASKKSTLNVANRAPQLDSINRGVWKCSEVAIRRLNAELKRTLVIVTLLDYGKAPYATVQESNGGAKIAIPLSFHKIIYVAPVGLFEKLLPDFLVGATKSISGFQSASCISVSNRDPDAQPIIQNWIDCKRSVAGSKLLPKPQQPKDTTVESTLRAILFGDKNKISQDVTHKCRE